MCSSGSYNKWLSRQLVRTGFGLSLLFAGIAHYRDANGFAISVGDGLGPDWLVSLGTMWGYVLPALMIVGGLSLTLKMSTKLGVLAAGLALISIPAGLMLKSALGMSLGDTMPATQNALIWIVVYLFAVKGSNSCCATSCATSCPCGIANCNCPTDSVSAPVKSMPKKASAKKVGSRK